MNRSTLKDIVLTSWLAVLVFGQACAPAEEPELGQKVGLHIDAVLEFVVEYPLDWSKDRRVPYNSNRGEVRWTHPQWPDSLLRVTSIMPQRSQEHVNVIDVLGSEYPELEITLDEQAQLPAGEARHISGRMKETLLDIYFLTLGQRTYAISLTAPPEQKAASAEVLSAVLQSFQPLP